MILVEATSTYTEACIFARHYLGLEFRIVHRLTAAITYRLGIFAGSVWGSHR